jgi:hypothetical protein
VLWFPLAAVHALAHLRQLPRTLAPEWSALRATGGSGSATRVELNAGALLFGAIAGVVALSTSAPWAAPGVLTQALQGPVVAAILATGLVVLASRPWSGTSPRRSSRKPDHASDGQPFLDDASQEHAQTRRGRGRVLPDAEAPVTDVVTRRAVGHRPRRPDALLAVEHRPADVVPQPLVVEYELAERLRELVARRRLR